MNKLYAFGCSYTYGDETDMYYRDPLKPSADAWPQLLADKMELDCINLGVSGASNDLIFKNTLEKINEIENNDLVIVMMTFPDRKLINGVKDDKPVNAMPSEIDYTDYYINYHSEELGLLNFIQNFLSLQELLKNHRYYITFVTYEPFLYCKKYKWTKNLIIKTNHIIKPLRFGFYSLIGDKKMHPDSHGHKIISDTIYKDIAKTIK